MVANNIRGVLPIVTAAAVLLAAAPALAQSADLRHVRNGSHDNPVSPGEWVNGSLNAAQAHYLERYSVPYRVLITGLTTGAGNPHSLVIEWDIKKGGKHALDFVTYYNRIEPHDPAFGHPAEVIDPLAGLNPANFTLSPPVPADIIPAPSSAGSPVANQPTNAFNALPVNERRITIYNGTITGLSYVSEASPGVTDGSSSLKIDFIANSSSVLILWGGHIATSEVWGEGNSAAQIPGASYHTRLISLDGASAGNQDRSLSAQAVFIPEPPDCDIDGPNLVCPDSTNQYAANTSNPEATFEWTITSACGATFSDGTTTATSPTVDVIACGTCGTYTLNLVVTADNLTTECSRPFTISDTIAPQISGSIATTSSQCFGNLPAPATTITGLLQLMNPGATITDNCLATAELTVTSSVGNLSGTQCNGSRVRTYTVTDSCGNSSNVTHTFTHQDTIGPAINGSIAATPVQCSAALPAPAANITQLLALLGGGTITDNCTATNSLTVTSSDGSLNGTTCSGTRVRTYTVRDACNNSAIITHTFNIFDNTPPVINGSIPSDSIECDSGGLPPPATTIGQLLALMNPGATIGDNCTATQNLTVTHVDNPPQGTGCDGSLIRTYRVHDGCGNSTPVDQPFSISDEIPPVITAPPTAHVECGNAFPAKANSLAALQAQGGNASDDCALESIQWVSDEQISPGAECPVTYKRVYRATDACGNTALSDQLIVLQDSTPPIICCTPALVEGCLDFPVLLQVPIVTDECGMSITPVPVRSDGLGIGEGFPIGDTTVTWTAQDGCGNAAEPLVITVRVKQCPVFTTKTQGQWSNASGGAEGSLVQTLLTGPNGGPLIVGRNSGDAPRSFSIGQAAAACLGTRLPASGTATTLPANLGNKALNSETCQTSNPSLPLTNSGKFKNSLIGHTIALMLNSRYNKFLTGNTEFNALKLCPVMTTIDANGTVKSYVIPAAVLSKLAPNPTVAKLRDLGRDALAGVNVAPATTGNINTAIARINQLFSSNLGHVALLKTSCFQNMSESSYNPLLFGDDETGGTGSDVVIGDTANPNSPRTPSANATVNSGAMAPGENSGVLKINGDYVQEPNATLIIELRGSEPVTGYDQVLINGNAFLHGLLLVNIGDDFTPTVGQHFHIIWAESINGEFDAVEVAPIGGLMYLDVQYTPAQVVVEVRTLAKPGDFDENGAVDGTDLLALLNQWNATDSAADLDGNGTVNAADMVILLGNWGSYAQLTPQ